MGLLLLGGLGAVEDLESLLLSSSLEFGLGDLGDGDGDAAGLLVGLSAGALELLLLELGEAADLGLAGGGLGALLGLLLLLLGGAGFGALGLFPVLLFLLAGLALLALGFGRALPSPSGLGFAVRSQLLRHG